MICAGVNDSFFIVTFGSLENVVYCGAGEDS